LQQKTFETVAYLRQKAHDGTAKAASSHTAKGGGLLLELGKTTPYPLAFTMPGRRRSTSGYCSMTIINNDSIVAPLRCVELCQVDETFAATANTPIIVSTIRAARCINNLSNARAKLEAAPRTRIARAKRSMHPAPVRAQLTTHTRMEWIPRTQASSEAYLSTSVPRIRRDGVAVAPGHLCGR